MPLIEIPVTLTVLPVPTFLFKKLAAVYAELNTSPLTLSSLNVTVAVVLPSYTLLMPAALTISVLAVMSAVVAAVVLAV